MDEVAPRDSQVAEKMGDPSGSEQDGDGQSFNQVAAPAAKADMGQGMTMDGPAGGVPAGGLAAQASALGKDAAGNAPPDIVSKRDRIDYGGPPAPEQPAKSMRDVDGATAVSYTHLTLPTSDLV